ncbi:MAG: carbamoyltransferase HypF [bacterium]|nr:carbamoyltransferase HypF [bacterium]
MTRIYVQIKGRVQGIGFRPFVFRLASTRQLCGWVRNGPLGVEIQVQGEGAALRDFLLHLELDLPPLAAIHQMSAEEIEPEESREFLIAPSLQVGEPEALVLPDLATCPDCLAEVKDPTNRRYRYPFTNCTSCGPRFSIISGLPYDRPATTMKGFKMCPACQAEYENPADRRFHAQPNACPDCGPQVQAFDPAGTALAQGEAALALATNRLKAGEVVALKGIGGFLLLCRADQAARINQLREAKHRAHKPFALMLPNLDWAHRLCHLEPAEEVLLKGPEAPILLARRRFEASEWVAEAVAPGALDLGVMLPYSPLHHLVLSELDLPLLATSGNQGGEPICTELSEAIEKLGGLCDLILDHNRPIIRPMEDSVVRYSNGGVQVLRLARGYAPLVLDLGHRLETGLALAGQQKTALALSKGSQVILGAYLGDMDNPRAQAGFEQAAQDLPKLYRAQPQYLASDEHPGYYGSRWAASHDLPRRRFSHHRSHLWALMAEARITGEILGFAWDGTGLGDDGNIWGGEVFAGPADQLQRIAGLPSFALIGGEAAMAEPIRIAYALWYQIKGEAVFERPEDFLLPALPPTEAALWPQMLAKGLNCPQTSSMGRLFDGVSAWLGCCCEVTYEGQGAIELEQAARRWTGRPPAALEGEPMDWPALLVHLQNLVQEGASLELCASVFHNQLTAWIGQLAAAHPAQQVLLSGGCFQNRWLSEAAVLGLKELGKIPVIHRLLPPNDGALAVGQLFGALFHQENRHVSSLAR